MILVGQDLFVFFFCCLRMEAMAKFHQEMPERTFRMLSANHPDWSFMLCRYSHSMSLASGFFCPSWIWVVSHGMHGIKMHETFTYIFHFIPLPISLLVILVKRRYQDGSGRLLSRCLVFLAHIMANQILLGNSRL